jgi:hypothetical protein
MKIIFWELMRLQADQSARILLDSAYTYEMQMAIALSFIAIEGVEC